MDCDSLFRYERTLRGVEFILPLFFPPKQGWVRKVPKKRFKQTTRPGSEDTTLVVGDAVRCEREEPAKGTWLMYANRIGRVQTINRQQSETNPEWTYVEIGVKFTLGGRVSWFRDDELVKVDPAPAWIAELENDMYEELK